MARSSPRAKSDQQAFIVSSNGRKTLFQVADIGMGGAGLDLEHTTDHLPAIEGDKVLLELFSDGRNALTTTCKVAHKETRRIGVSFLGMERGGQQQLWRNISALIKGNQKCDYCGASVDKADIQCHHCGWKLNYHSADYFSYWEKECLLRSMTDCLKNLTIDDLHRIRKGLIEEIAPIKSSPELDPIEEFVGVSPAMKTVFDHIRKVAPTELPVLILGESGTGKELTARAVYERSDRTDRPFVVINCSAIPESLIESELFGHTKGAFTGAIQAKKGKFELADKGTLFLDEIGDLPLKLQPKLLRFLEDKTIQRIGALNGKVVDVRVIAATNVDLEAAVKKGLFRPDLFHRIANFTIHLPPLRERDACKEVLAKYFLKKIKMERGWNCKGFTTEALNAICTHSWPGNVRELINRIRRAVVVQDEWIRPEDMELEPGIPTERISSLKMADEKLKRRIIASALNTHKYNISRTARALGISRPYVYMLIKKLDIVLPARGRR